MTYNFFSQNSENRFPNLKESFTGIIEFTDVSIYFIFQKGIIGNAITYLLKQRSHNQFHNQVLVTSVDSTSLMELQCDCIKKGTGATGYGHGWK